MKITSLGEIIATREYFLDGRQAAVLVKIGGPARIPDHTDYYCPYEIVGLGRGGIRYACGVDEVQALMLAMQNIGATLYASEEAQSGRLTWLDVNNRDLGLPLPK